MLREWERKYPGRCESIFNALGNVVSTHLLDRALRDFGAIRAEGSPVSDGDLAGDADPAAMAGAAGLRIVARAAD
jgi:tRNA 2-thiocytidine biosynthesis protein TtcA